VGNLSTLSATGMRGINRSAILEIIRRESPISRTAIAQKLQVSLPTVMRIVDDLIEEGLVRTQNEKEWSGGRRRSLLEFNASEHVVVGVDLGGTKIYGAIADVGGRILEEVEVRRHQSSGEESFDVLTTVIETLMASPKLEGRRLHGIGVGVPGVTLHHEGIVVWAPSLNWRDYPLREKLSERFSVPIMVDNDLNLAALGEHWFGAAQNNQTVVLVSLGTGIGAGIIINGALFRGARQSAGEVGYMLPGREFLGTNYDTFGALETVASGSGITARAREALKDQLSAAALANLTAESVFEAETRGEPWAQKIVNDAIDCLALMAVNISALIDPEIIVLSGGIMNSKDMVTPILKRIEGALPVLPEIVTSPLGYQATVLGAIVNVLQNTDDFYRVHKLS
jgi:glucokinase